MLAGWEAGILAGAYNGGASLGLGWLIFGGGRGNAGGWLVVGGGRGNAGGWPASNRRNTAGKPGMLFAIP
jgi:hypothetical protein